MSDIADIAGDALKSAHTDFVKSRRNLWLAVALLALIHLLSVSPYLKASREIATIDGSMRANATLVARLSPDVERLKRGGERAAERLDALLGGATEGMIAEFAALRQLVQRALKGDVPAASTAGDSTFRMPQQMQQMQQMGQSNLAAQPPMQEQSGPAAEQHVAATVSPELRVILQALAAKKPDAFDRLIAHARADIVETAYARVQQAWRRGVRPAYLNALQAVEDQARGVATDAPSLAADTAAALLAAADTLAAQRGAIEAIEISHDSIVDEALGTDWWRTVEGKGAFADAVASSIDAQMREIAEAASTPSAAIEKALALQRQLRDDVVARQAELERQFAAQRAQLATLSGASGAVPVDLVSFIGLFPLLLGLAIGFLILRTAQARRDAAMAAGELARVAPQDRETRIWLTRRLLAGGDARGAALATVAMALGAVLWTGLAALQLRYSPMNAPLSPTISGGLAAFAVIVATAWDIVKIRHLDRCERL